MGCDQRPRPAAAGLRLGHPWRRGSTRDRTIRLTGRIAAETDLLPVGHLTCGLQPRRARRDRRPVPQTRACTILALRGDPPGGLGTAGSRTRRASSTPTSWSRWSTAAATSPSAWPRSPEGHPEAATLDDDAKVLRTKQDAGADFAVTQFFFSTSDYFDLVGRARQMGAELPIIPGIMPVTSVRQIERFADLSGAAFPPELAARFHEVADDSQAVIDLGWRSPPRCARSCSTAALLGCTSTPSTARPRRCGCSTSWGSSSADACVAGPYGACRRTTADEPDSMVSRGAR